MGKIVNPFIKKMYHKLIKDTVEDLHKPVVVYLDPETADCPNCFEAGTLVDTPFGLSSIENIIPGDHVLDGQGNVKEVTATMTRSGHVEHTTLKTHGNSIGITATSNHNVFVYENRGSLYEPKVGRRIDKPISEVEQGDLLFKAVRPLPEKPLKYLEVDWKNNKYGPKRNLDPVVPITDDFLFSYGLYLAEGCTSKGRQVQYCLNTRELDEGYRVSEYWKSIIGCNYSLCGRSGSDKNAVFELYSSHLADFFDKYCGHGAENKYICKDLYYRLDRDQTLTLLSGLFFGDGHYDSEFGVWTLGQTSKVLAYQVYNLLLSCGFSSSIILTKSKTGIDGIHRRDVYFVKYWEDKSKNLRGTVRTSSGVFQVVKQIESQCKDSVVYNIEVEGSHTYSASGFSVHNCIIDPLTGRSTGTFDSSFVSSTTIFGETISPVSFNRSRCPVCFGEGKLKSENTVTIKALVKWEPGDDLQVLPVGREGAPMVRIKALRGQYDNIKNANYFLVDGVKCELIKPPTIRGLGKQEELVIAFLQSVEVGKDVNK